MDPEPIVFDISSDEEPSYGRMDDPNGDGLTWLAEILGVAGDRENPSDDDSDDVIVLREVKASEKLNPSKTDEEDDDDDCVILDGDPDKPVVEESDSRSDSDELLIVSEKGQVACRDYPHPRHLCVTFPFSSTPHEKHCGLCHCYVCDKPSPCLHWESNSSVIDHCHATDKGQTWKEMRRNLKSGKITLPPDLASKLPTTIPVALPLPMPRWNPVQSLTVARLCPSTTTTATPSSTIHGCSSAVLSAPSPIPNQTRSSQFGPALSNNRFQPSSVLPGQQIRDSNINVLRRGKPGQPFGNSSSRYIPPNPTIFKRPAIIRVPRPGSLGGVSLPMNQTGFGASNFPRFHAPAPPPMNSSYRPDPGFAAARAPLLRQQFASQLVPPFSQRVAVTPVSQSFYVPEILYPPATSESSIFSQNPSLEEVQSPGVCSGSPRGYDPSWVNNALNYDNNNNADLRNIQQLPLADNCQPQVIVALEPSNKSLLPKDSTSHLGAENVNTSAHSELKDWHLETLSVLLSDPLVDDSPIMQSNNIYSPESAFFDFATPWSDLTRA